MSRIGHVAFALLLVLDLAAFGAGALAQTPPQGVTPTGSPIPYSRALIPLPGTSIRMQARIFRPPGAGPFRLAIISHGTDELDFRREQHVIPEYRAMVALLLRRGYAVVVPQRPGHGETGGPYFETAGDCDFADFATAGHATARSIKATIEYMGQQPYVRRNRAVLIGHSAGAWGSLALASRYPDLVESVINFSGGRGGHSYDKANQNCSPERLVQTAAILGGPRAFPHSGSIRATTAISVRRSRGRWRTPIVPPAARSSFAYCRRSDLRVTLFLNCRRPLRTGSRWSRLF